MDHRLIRTFVTTAQSPTFGAAAARLRITQPALTKQVQQLERLAGTVLFVRGRRGARLTAAGRALLAEATELDRRLQEFDHRLRRLAAGEEGHLALGFGLSSIELAPSLVARFRDRCPEITVALDDLPSSVQVERLRTGSLDGAFVRMPVPSDLEATPLARDRLAIACARGVEPPGAGALAAWLEDHPLVRLRPARGPGLTAQVDAMLEELGCRPEVAQEADDLQTVLALTAAHLGVAVVPASAERIAPPGVQLVAIDLPRAEWEVGFAWNPGATSGALRRFLTMLD